MCLYILKTSYSEDNSVEDILLVEVILVCRLLLWQNFWSMLKKFMHKSTREQILELKQISTDVGRCRVCIQAIYSKSVVLQL